MATNESPVELLSRLKSCRYVDLTHAFEPGSPHFPGFPDEVRETIYAHREGEGTLGSGFLVHRYAHVGQWGTHADPPNHFIDGGASLDAIAVDDMMLPLAVLDIHERVAGDPDSIATLDDVRAWEARHGAIPAGGFVALRTDWSKRWPDPVAMKNADDDGTAHYPGWGPDALAYLFQERRIIAVGHETTDTDPGTSTSRGDYAMERYVLMHGRYQIELLANLDQVPESGAIVVAAFPKPKDGSGFPARVFAICP
ncbi:Putative cyclase [Planctomycetes bacterium Pan216]|uniref:Cyclase n=1 Tax=Kolteria novifilia TaxID=2527975 RepID=A0A518B1M9_9BACT|nr:Putative cyclase [Planctomycetes bacterium Pan216]